MGARTVLSFCVLPLLVLLAGGRPLASTELALFYAGFILPALPAKSWSVLDSLAAAVVSVPLLALASLNDEPGACAWPAAAGLVFLTGLFSTSAREKLGRAGPAVSGLFFALPALIGYISSDLAGGQASIGIISPYWAVAAGTTEAGLSALAVALGTGALLALPARSV